MSEPTLIEVADTATPPVVNGVAPTAPLSSTRSEPPRQGAGSLWKKILIPIVIVGGLATFVAVRGVERAKQDVRSAYDRVAGSPKMMEPEPVMPSQEAWDGLVTLTKEERDAIGLRIATVEAQTKPILLELNGTTDYDQNTLRKIRPLFDARVTQVFKSTGQTVKKGEPLVELYSTAMAGAKADFRSKYA
jgi:cobalt-zinc-cadmium efflux system membrane fusion protein